MANKTNSYDQPLHGDGLKIRRAATQNTAQPLARRSLDQRSFCIRRADAGACKRLRHAIEYDGRSGRSVAHRYWPRMRAEVRSVLRSMGELPGLRVRVAVQRFVYSPFIIGWALSGVNDRHLTLRSANRAVKRRCPIPVCCITATRAHGRGLSNTGSSTTASPVR
jgi:hypothetical protein